MLGQRRIAPRAARARRRLDRLREALVRDEPIGAERVLLLVVAAARSDDGARSPRQLRRAARWRRRRLGVASFTAGPLAGIASQVIDLYCDSAIVCDLAAAHALELSDEQIAAHLLVLWSVAGTLEQAEALIARSGGASVEQALAARLREPAARELPATLTPRTAIRMLSEVRDHGRRLRRHAGPGAVRRALFPGRHTRRAIRRAQMQLGLVS